MLRMLDEDETMTYKNLTENLPSRVVETVLTSRKGVEIDVNPQTILPCPFNCLQEISGSIIRPRSPTKTRVTYLQETPSRKGSFSRVSMAQKPIGIRSQFNPAPAISAKSFSV